MAIQVKQIFNNTNILPSQESNLVSSKNMVRSFGLPEDYVELQISDPLGKNLYSVSPFKNYKLPGTFQATEKTTVNELIFSPETDIANLGILRGNYILQYNILRPKIYLGYDRVFFIKEISSNRQEIRLSTNNISNAELEANTVSFISEIQNLGYFKEFYINLGNNVFYPAVNIALDKNKFPYSIIIKLLNPLPSSVKVNTLLSIVDLISNPKVFEVKATLDTTPITYPTLRGANFDLDIDEQRIGSSPYYNLNNITTFTNSTASMQIQRLLGALSSSNFSLNVDYSRYEDFVHFSSANRRLGNFQYKLAQIELFTSASASAATNPGIPASLIDASNYQAKINNIIQGFDGYDRFLYYESSSYSWPKVNSTQPYINSPSTSSAGVVWFTSQSVSASLYDDNNSDYLLYTLPSYISENTDNEQLFDFVATTGQMFDDIWLYIKGITDLYKAKNSLNDGISKDLVFYALQSLGIKLYNDQDQVTALNYIYGINDNGTYLPLSSSYSTMVTASQYGMSGQDIQKSIYKRIYSNLPLLLKSKGTNRFIQYLNTIYGIPSTILYPIEYGGADKVTSSFEYEYDRFTYAVNTSGSGTIRTKWTGANTIEFRFKPNVSTSYPLSQSLLQVNAFNTSSYLTSSNNVSLGIGIYYTGSNGTTRGKFVTSTTGSLVTVTSASYDYAYFKLFLSSSNGITSASSQPYALPVFTTGSNNDTDWWNIALVNTGSTVVMYVGREVNGSIGYNGNYIQTVSATGTYLWSTSYNAGLTLGGANNSNIIAPNGTIFNGQFQELRAWSSSLSFDAISKHWLNPYSIEGSTTGSAYDSLVYRFPLGNNLFTYNHTTSSTVYSTQPNQSTIYTASFFNFPNKNNYESFVETYYANTAISAYDNPVTNKVKIVSGSAIGNVLLPNKSITNPELVPNTKDIHLLDSGLSIQDEINKDIIAQYGSTYNVDDILGNPRKEKDQYYSAFNTLRTQYFKKYTKKSNYKDFTYLAEFFHNSLFKTLKDFLPAKTNVATGIIVKPHLLDRNIVYKYNPSSSAANNLSQSIAIETIEASNGGAYSASLYNKTVQGALGPVTNISDARDFYTGELTGSVLDLNDAFYKQNPFAIFSTYATASYSQSIWNVEYNPTLNNVADNRLSTIRQKLEFQTPTLSVTSSIQLQDFTYDYTRHNRPRFVGSTTTSTLYNFHTTLDDDIPSLNRGLGQAPTIDKHTFKYAFLSEAILSGSDNLVMPERTNLYIKYLIDPSGSLTELVKRNYDTLNDYQKQELYQVQRMFPKNESLNVGLFDNQTPSRQQLLDGNHNIFAGGFKYHPVLWNRTGTASVTYELAKPILTTSTVSSGGGGGGGGSSTYTAGDFSISYTLTKVTSPYTTWLLTVRVTSDVGAITENISISTSTQWYVPAELPSQTSFITVNMNTGATSGTGTVYLGNFYNTPSIIDQTVMDVVLQSGGGGSTTSTYNTYVSTSIDTNPVFKVHLSSSNTLIASAQMSRFYRYNTTSSYTSDGFYFLGDGASPEYGTANYIFDLQPGDLIRLYSTASSATGFSILEEYEIAKINLPTTTTSMSFSLNRNINLTTISSLSGLTGSINRYIISRKIPDETNIVIDFQKQGGQTAAGIVKNVNLDDTVNNNIANIVSDLKSKIFSTVLVQ